MPRLNHSSVQQQRNAWNIPH